MSDGFAHGEPVVRERRRLVANAAAGRPRPGDWTDPDTLPIEGAYVAASSSRSTRTATRDEVLTAKSLYCDPDVDVAPGDRIRAAGRVYEVDAVPAADVNPFTGWQPEQEIALKEVTG